MKCGFDHRPWLIWIFLASVLLLLLAAGCDARGLAVEPRDASIECPFGWGPYPDANDPTGWTCQCEQGCGPCPDGWHRAGQPYPATCEQNADSGWPFGNPMPGPPRCGAYYPCQDGGE